MRFLDRFHKIYVIKRETSKRMHVVRGETDNNSNDVQITYGLTLGRELEKPLKVERSKNGQSRNPNSNMPEI